MNITIENLEMRAGADMPRDSLTLTLRRAFEVTEVQLDGAAVTFTREGDLLRLQPTPPLPADRPFSATLRYRGAVADWRLDASETVAALAAEEFVWLPSTWGWYPVPGEQRLTWEIGTSSMVFRALADRTTPFNEAEPAFDVCVRAPAGVRFLAGFTQDVGGTWRLQASRNQVTLLGGKWWARGEGAARFAVPFEELDTWQTGKEDLQRLLAALAGWTGIEPLTVVPSPLWLTNAGDVSLIMDTDLAGQVYQAAPDRQQLVGGNSRWLFRLLRFEPRMGADSELYALRAYTLACALEDAFGPDAPLDPSGLALSEAPRVEAWAARTSREAQKAALRRLFHDVLQRPLTPADLAFLDEGGAE